jgi:hypothetical protein
VEISVFSLSSVCNNTCQYPRFRSNVENHFTYTSLSKVSSFHRSRKQSFVMSFNFWYYTQYWRPPSFWTSTSSNNQVLSDLWITPVPYMSLTMQFTFAFLSKVSLHGGWWIGHSVLVSIWWYTLFVCLFATLAMKMSLRWKQTWSAKSKKGKLWQWFMICTTHHM